MFFTYLYSQALKVEFRRNVSRLRWFKENKYEDVATGMETAYRQKLLPLEEAYQFHQIHGPPLTNADFHAKPMILFIGQYSTGKTSLIKFLLNANFPGIRIGPEPTTDRFIAVMFGPLEQVVPGSALVLDQNKQFGGLRQFGNQFLNRFQASLSPQPVLQWLTFIDTPGIISGERHRREREYDYPAVLKWFADRADRIILMLDAHKLDMSDELQGAIHVIHSNIDKLYVVLNKADLVDPYELIRVHGALMWSLSKTFNTPEVIRVFIGSFWNEPLRYESYRKLFASETKELIRDIESLPRNAALRKLNDLSKRARLAKAHALLMSHFHGELHGWWGLEKTRQKLIEEVPIIINELCLMNGLAPGDLPISSHVKAKLQTLDLSAFVPLRPKLVAKVDQMLTQDISTIMEQITKSMNEKGETQRIKGGVFDHFSTDTSAQEDNSLMEGRDSTIVKSNQSPTCIDQEFHVEAEEIFQSLLGTNKGKLSRFDTRRELLHSQLPDHVLNRILKLADYDSDGYFDIHEFTVALFLCARRCEGFDLPDHLPTSLQPNAQISSNLNMELESNNPNEVDHQTTTSTTTVSETESTLPKILPAFPPLNKNKQNNK